MKIAVVTGASSGLGREFARQLDEACDLDEIWLIARREDLLEETASLLSHARGVVIPLDLTSPAALETLVKRITDSSPTIQVLVNNAGFSQVGLFAELPLAPQLDMIDLNIKALVQLTYACLPHMPRGGTIFQVASTSGFLLGPRVAVYAASKAFVVSFAHALYQELRLRGIHVMTVSPGPVDTGFWQVASGRDDGTPAHAAPPAAVVRQALKDARRLKLNSTYGLASRINIFLPRILRRKTILRMSS